MHAYGYEHIYHDKYLRMVADGFEFASVWIKLPAGRQGFAVRLKAFGEITKWINANAVGGLHQTCEANADANGMFTYGYHFADTATGFAFKLRFG
ncbi:MAG: hypothetical protein EOP83_24170 [Verrucomicrobiaceae bacterium]|nr:MAG: hypothetical protein EOP83_24170 [Verrucomicrobiaceae bacterium]